MWREKVDGTPKLPEGIPALVPLQPLWRNVVVDHMKKNQQKELIRVGECLTKQSFIQQGILKYINVWKLMMERDAMYANDMVMSIIGNKSTQRSWVRSYLLRHYFRRDFGRRPIGSGTTHIVYPPGLGMMFLPIPLLRMIRSLTHIVSCKSSAKALL